MATNQPTSHLAQYPALQPNYGSAVDRPILTSYNFGEKSMKVTCPNCRQEINTEIERKAGILAWLSCCLFILLGCFLGCCLIPFCVSSFQDVEHKCPNCHIVLGRYKKIG